MKLAVARADGCVAIALVASLLAATAALADAAVDTTDWITISAGKAFTFKAPPGTVPYSDGGVPIDSFVNQFINPKFKLMFDYGLYSNDLSQFRSDPRYHFESVKIDGRRATIVTGPGGNAWGCSDELIALYMIVSHSWWTGRTIRLEMSGCTSDPKTISTLHLMLGTIRFISD